MAENRIDEEIPPTIASIAPLLPSPEDPTLYSADHIGISTIDSAKLNDGRASKEYEASYNYTSDNNVLVQDIDLSKQSSSAEESKPLEVDLVSEKSDVFEASVVPTDPPDKDRKPEAIPAASEEHDKKDDDGILASGFQKLTPSIASNEPGREAKKGGTHIHVSSHRPIMVRKSQSVSPNRRVRQQMESHRALVDTASHIGSVREAVTMFGGSADWKARKRNTMESIQLVDFKLSKVEKEIPECKKALEIAEKEQEQVLRELESTEKLIEDLKATLEKARIEEQQAKQDSEFAQLRVEEIKKGINNEASSAAKAELDTAKARHEAAVHELALVKDEMEILRREHLILVEEKETAVRKAEDAIHASKEAEKIVEQLTLELMSTKESIELADTCNLQAEEKRNQETLKQEQEMKVAEEEMQRLTDQFPSTKGLKEKLETASVLLNNLKTELSAYMKENMHSVEGHKLRTAEIEVEQGGDFMLNKLDPTSKELEEVRTKIDKLGDEVKSLRLSALSLTSELEREKLALAKTRQREGITAVTVTALEAELMKTRSEIEAARTREKEMQERMVELSVALRREAQECNQEKLYAQAAREELQRMKEDVELAKASAHTAASRLHAALKEIEASKASHKLALAAIQALNDSTTIGDQIQTSRVILSFIEYFELSKKAQEAEELASAKVFAAVSEIEAAREDELKTTNKIDSAKQELAVKREELDVANQKAESAIRAKLGVEQELRMWRAQLEQRRKAANSVPDVIINSTVSSPKRDPGERKELMSHRGDAQYPRSVSESKVENLTHDSITNIKKEKKMSLFPKIVMLLTRKKDSH